MQRNRSQNKTHRSERQRNRRRASTTPPSSPLDNTDGATGFTELGLAPALLQAVAATGYSQPTPIQTQAIPPALAGRDLLGCAQTGTGKTAAFALPILQRLEDERHPRRPLEVGALVLAPTRELAAQIAASFDRYGRNSGLRCAVVFGGVSKRPQIAALRRGVDVLVATPGRLLDLMGDRLLSLAEVRILVLDEADRMLDMGFIHDVRRIVRAMPRERQTMLFSATLPEEIRELAKDVLDEPVRVAVTPVASTVEGTEQSVFAVERPDKVDLLYTLLEDAAMERVLVFTRTKHGANKVANKLQRAGVSTAALHGNKSQGARERALEGFKQGHTRVIVATDIAARGLDVKGLSHVVNYDLPNEPETYVHRIGRTGRAGAVGVALSFCAQEERAHLASIERLIRRKIERAELPRLLPLPQTAPPSPPSANAPSRQPSTSGPRRRSHRRASEVRKLESRRSDSPEPRGPKSGSETSARSKSASRASGQRRRRPPSRRSQGPSSEAPWWQRAREGR